MTPNGNIIERPLLLSFKGRQRGITLKWVVVGVGGGVGEGVKMGASPGSGSINFEQEINTGPL